MNESLCFRISAIFLAFTVLFASCSSSTLIQSNPSGAKVYMNGEYKGVTPFLHSDTKIVGTMTDIRLELEGHETLHTMLQRNETVDVGAIIGGLFVFFPFLWTMKYNPVHTYELKPLMDASSTKSGQPTVFIDSKGNEYISCVVKD